ncbi:hypothetical protein FA95DRAFT_715231 [Auriscalpium vulgare]|uniref:Uncharacterized protein n=1 Tax=Auriscalpium vulgare TaxID=40419 RepID=A0ACB8RBB0_9AGAM|nr:hypothetical protein FA95DRAFT_715231 [Auriscalpium vulgare]
MHSNVALIALIAASAASSTVAAPLHDNQARAFERELAAREPLSLGGIGEALGSAFEGEIGSGLKALGTGILGGAAVPLINKVLGGNKDSSAASRELAAREPLSLGGIGEALGSAFEGEVGSGLKALGTGVLGGAAVPLINKLFGSKDSTAASRREILEAFGARDEEELLARGNILGSLLGATEDSLGTVLKTSAAGGLAAGAVGAIGSKLLDLFNGNKDSSQSRRELEERFDLAGIAESLGPIEKGLIGTVVGLGASSAASGVLGKIFGSSDKSSRDVTPEQVLASLILASRSFDELD